jgi:hypothetical protein
MSGPENCSSNMAGGWVSLILALVAWISTLGEEPLLLSKPGLLHRQSGTLARINVYSYS